MECVLFEVVSRGVRDARPDPEGRVGRRRSANSKARTRVSKDEDGRWVRPHASRRIAARLSCGSASARRAAMLLSMRATAPRILAKRTQDHLAIRVVPAKAGTHDRRRWLWVPALAALGRDDDGLVHEEPTCGCTQ